jgi:hypothetical protein
MNGKFRRNLDEKLVGKTLLFLRIKFGHIKGEKEKTQQLVNNILKIKF